MTCGASVAIEVVVFLRESNFVSNSSSNSLLLCFCSKIIVSFTVGACEASSST
jgi:hypothetical protein